MDEAELIKFLQWYWKEVDGKPYDILAKEIVKEYLNVD